MIEKWHTGEKHNKKFQQITELEKEEGKMEGKEGKRKSCHQK